MAVLLSTLLLFRAAAAILERKEPDHLTLLQSGLSLANGLDDETLAAESMRGGGPSEEARRHRLAAIFREDSVVPPPASALVPSMDTERPSRESSIREEARRRFANLDDVGVPQVNAEASRRTLAIRERVVAQADTEETQAATRARALELKERLWHSVTAAGRASSDSSGSSGSSGRDARALGQFAQPVDDIDDEGSEMRTRARADAARWVNRAKQELLQAEAEEAEAEEAMAKDAAAALGSFKATAVGKNPAEEATEANREAADEAKRIKAEAAEEAMAKDAAATLGSAAEAFKAAVAGKNPAEEAVEANREAAGEAERIEVDSSNTSAASEADVMKSTKVNNESAGEATERKGIDDLEAAIKKAKDAIVKEAIVEKARASKTAAEEAGPKTAVANADTTDKLQEEEAIVEKARVSVTAAEEAGAKTAVANANTTDKLQEEGVRPAIPITEASADAHSVTTTLSSPASAALRTGSQPDLRPQGEDRLLDAISMSDLQDMLVGFGVAAASQSNESKDTKNIASDIGSSAEGKHLIDFGKELQKIAGRFAQDGIRMVDQFLYKSAHIRDVEYASLVATFVNKYVDLLSTHTAEVENVSQALVDGLPAGLQRSLAPLTALLTPAGQGGIRPLVGDAQALLSAVASAPPPPDGREHRQFLNDLQAMSCSYAVPVFIEVRHHNRLRKMAGAKLDDVHALLPSLQAQDRAAQNINMAAGPQAQELLKRAVRLVDIELLGLRQGLAPFLEHATVKIERRLQCSEEQRKHKEEREHTRAPATVWSRASRSGRSRTWDGAAAWVLGTAVLHLLTALGA